MDTMNGLALQPTRPSKKLSRACICTTTSRLWGHGLGRLFRDLPDAVQECMEAELPELVERMRILDALYIPTRYPDSLPDGAPSDHFGHLQSTDALTHAGALVDAIAAQMA